MTLVMALKITYGDRCPFCLSTRFFLAFQGVHQCHNCGKWFIIKSGNPPSIKKGE